MERLTERNADGSVKYAKGCYSGCGYITCSMEEGYQCNHQCEADVVCKLADYEDAEEQGLLLRLPCKVGDKVFYVDSIRKFIDECEVRRIECKSLDERHMGITLEMIGSLWHCVRAELIGNDIFLTKEEAEQALKQMGE